VLRPAPPQLARTRRRQRGRSARARVAPVHCIAVLRMQRRQPPRHRNSPARTHGRCSNEPLRLTFPNSPARRHRAAIQFNAVYPAPIGTRSFGKDCPARRINAFRFRLHKRRPSCTKRSLISSSFCMLPSSCSSSAGWSLSWSATRRAGIGSMQFGSGLHTSWPSQWSCFKLGLAWSALLQHLSRGFVFKVVHRATPQASSNTGSNVCSSTRLPSGSSPRCTPFSPQRSLQHGGAIRPGGLPALAQQGLPALQLQHPKQNHPVPLPPLKSKGSFQNNLNI